MPIEFECPGCGATLRVGDEAAGRKAECPKCGRLSQLPEGAAPESAISVPAAAGAGGDSRGDLGSALGHAGGELLIGPLLPSRMDLGDVVRRSFNTYGVQFGICLAATAIFFAIQLGFWFISVMVRAIGEQSDPLSVEILIAAGQLVLDSWLGAGMVLFFLRVIRGRSPEINDLFGGGRYLLRIVIVTLLLGCLFMGIMLVGVGIPAAIGHRISGVQLQKQLEERPAEEKNKDSHPDDEQHQPDHDQAEQDLLAQIDQKKLQGATFGAIIGGLICLVPLIILGLIFSQSQFLIVDRDVGSIESLRLSLQITRGNKVSLFLLGILGGLIVIAGIFACCIGLLFALPLVYLFMTTAYLAMSGQLSGNPPAA